MDVKDPAGSVRHPLSGIAANGADAADAAVDARAERPDYEERPKDIIGPTDFTEPQKPRPRDFIDVKEPDFTDFVDIKDIRDIRDFVDVKDIKDFVDVKDFVDIIERPVQE